MMRDLNEKFDNNLRLSLGHSFSDSLMHSLRDSLEDSLWNNLEQTAQSAQNVKETNDA